jgi:putative redox protein
MRTQNAEFAGSRGAALAARLELPAGTPRGYALFAHPFSGGPDPVAAAPIARALTESGIAVLHYGRTDPAGPDEDSGTIGFSASVDDLVRAAEYLRANFQAPFLLIGHSLGGATVLAARHRIPEVRAVATIAAPVDSDDMPQADRVADLDAALLVLHSPADEVVSVDAARRIFDAARHPKSFVALDGADHLLTDPADGEYAAAVLAAWAGRYAPGPADHRDDGTQAEGSVVVAENGIGPLGQAITAGRYVLTADEPVPIGADGGPTPYDLLLAAFGACTSMTVRMYANRKKWPLRRVTVRLRHSRVHAADCADCADCETRVGLLDRIDRTIQLEGDLDDEQRQRLLEIADKCPVHRTLRSEIDVRTSVG